MAEEENSLIGYDPLAWMLEPEKEQEMPVAAVAMPEAEQVLEAPLEADEPSGLSIEIEDSPWQDLDLEAGEESPPSIAAKIELEAVLSLQRVGELHEKLLDALERFDKIEIDASAVTMADTATLQLLLILKRTAIKQSKDVVIDFPSDRFVEACDLLGLSEMLGVDQATAGFF